MKENPYHVLGLSEEATITQIKEQYRELSKVFHPDKQRHEYYEMSVQEFERIDQAYKILGNEFNKMVYDNFGHHGVELVIEHRHHFEKLEQEFNQGKNVIAKLHDELEVLHTYELELHSHSTLKYLEFDTKLMTSLFATNKNQYGVNLIQIVDLPRISQVEFAFRTECAYMQQKKDRLIMQKNFLTAATSFNLPLVGICGAEVSTQFKDYSINFDHLAIVKQFRHCEIKTSINGQDYIPSITMALENKGEQFQIGLHPKQISVVSKLSPKTSLTVVFVQNQLITDLLYQLYKEAFYSSTIRLSLKAQSLQKQEISLTNNFWVIFKNMRFDFITRYLPQDGSMQVQFGAKKFNSGFRFPFEIRVDSITGVLFWMIAPHILPYIWSKNWFNPWKHLESKKRAKYAQKLQEYHKYNEESREVISQGDNYQKFFQYENEKNGLIVLEAYVGEWSDIQQVMRNGIANDFLVNVKEQLQAEVCDSGLFVPACCIDRLDGFFKLESKKNSEYFWGYIRYSNGGKIEKKIWNYNEGISIGNVCGQKKSSIIEKILGYIYQ